jgi:GT2 family glycosyltransferase
VLRASVIVPTYNRRALLLKTLSSLEQQTVDCRQFEVVVVVDGATDGTAEALARWSGRLNLRWIETENGGLARARNRGAGIAIAPVLIFLDDDQRATPELVERHIEAHERGPSVLVQGFYPVDPTCLRGGASRLYDRTYRRAMAAAATAPSEPFTIWGGNCSVRRDVFQCVGGFDGELFRTYGCEDTDFGLRALAVGIPPVYEPRASSFHLHSCSYASLRRHPRQEGAAVARLNERHRLSRLATTRPNRLTSALVAGWRRVPALMRAGGEAATVGLQGADRLPWPALQVTFARAIRKIYLAEGLATARPEAAEGSANSG